MRGPSGPACAPRPSTPRPVSRSPGPGTARRSSTAPGTASAWSHTRIPTSWRATPSRSAPGMAFSIEPGIYPGPNGARIEDIVVCTEDGGERLNNVTRDLVLADG